MKYYAFDIHPIEVFEAWKITDFYSKNRYMAIGAFKKEHHFLPDMYLAAGQDQYGPEEKRLAAKNNTVSSKKQPWQPATTRLFFPRV